MAFWPRLRSRPPIAESPAPPAQELLVLEDFLRRNVEDIFQVEDRQLRGYAVIFGGRLLVSPARALAILEPRFRPHGYTPFFKAERGKHWIQALPLAEVTAGGNPLVNVLLFAATCISTIWAGSGVLNPLAALAEPERLWHGISFGFVLLSILGTHEFGHYFTARYYGAAVSLPYFIPAPPPFIFGTLGAIIKLKTPARDRNSLFDIAVAGPLAGLLIALPASVLGFAWSRPVALTPESGGLVLGESLLTSLLKYLAFGPLPDGVDVLLHPVGLAAWVGLFVTALNLFPVGQLDGGRIAYALFGPHHRKVSLATFVALLALGAITGSLNWVVWAALLFFLIGFHHTAPLDDLTPLSPGRRALGVASLLLLVLLIPPVPIQLQ